MVFGGSTCHASNEKTRPSAKMSAEKKRVVDAIDAASMGGGDVKNEPSLVELYQKWFDVIPATTAELVTLSQQLRYQVYCIETGFESSTAFPDRCERDHYDSHSVCSLLLHRPSGLIAGTVRLILPKEDTGLPVLNMSSDLSALDGNVLPRARTGEISRFAISKEFRKRREDSLLPAYYEKGNMGHDQRVIPHITLGLMQAVLRMSIENQVSHLGVLIEPALDRLIRKLGIYFKPVGEMINHNGRRRAHYREISELLDDVYVRNRDVWGVLTDDGRLWPEPLVR